MQVETLEKLEALAIDLEQEISRARTLLEYTVYDIRLETVADYFRRATELELIVEEIAAVSARENKQDYYGV